MTRSDAWARHNALKDFYYGCPDDATWQRHKSAYLQAYKEWQGFRKSLSTVYRSRWEGMK